MEAVLTEVFGGQGGDGRRTEIEKHGSGASPSTARRRGHREVKKMTPR
jgi:hypothetical protein